MSTSLQMPSPVHAKKLNKRFAPSFWEHDWYILKSLRASIESFVARDRQIADAQTIVDMGCGEQPYEPLFRSPGCRYVGCDLEGDVDVHL